ncbi:receptor-like protein 2 [Rutidosis leptorrhynchoides]|uniref:receptor-like protein 2 n=1 Tax=Rutidosis leptorrhynchoides TaxID=125765 RepID=UPI003A99998F
MSNNLTALFLHIMLMIIIKTCYMPSIMLAIFLIMIQLNIHLTTTTTYGQIHRHLDEIAVPASTCNPLDKESLLQLATNFHNLNWSASIDCCSWDGITCDDKRNRVIELSLPLKGLAGAIPFSIQNLTFLSLLDLSRNLLSGPIPNGFFSSFKNLEIVDLSYNTLSGELNQILPAICTNSPDLAVIDFSNNLFNGNIPPNFSTCSKLRVLSLGYNEITGGIPIDIGGAQLLQYLSVPDNFLTGEIGESITNLTNLKSVVLFDNFLTGSVPSNIGKLSLLERLELQSNKLTKTMPFSLMNCTKLQVLNLRSNYLFGRLADLDFSKLSDLRVIDLGVNQFTGLFPRTLFSCKSLIALRLSNNMLQGEVFTDVLELPSLTFLGLSNCTLKNITKTLSILSNHTKLTTLILSNNFFNETLPDVGISGFIHIKVIGLGGCKLFGKVPSWLRSLTTLEILDLSENHINETIPGWLHTLPNLFSLDLSNNSLSGSFPVELTKLQALSPQMLDHANSSKLELPLFVAPANNTYLRYNLIVNLPPALYLNGNQLKGEIPTEIGHLRLIHILDLSNNNFSGKIPESISNLRNLEELDLSHNHLSGVIPGSLTKLNFLSSLNVSDNDLQGVIPTGGQFDTFLNQSYANNPGLCGSPMQRSCNSPSALRNFTSGHKDGPHDALIDGLTVGICVGFTITLICQAWWIFCKKPY